MKPLILGLTIIDAPIALIELGEKTSPYGITPVTDYQKCSAEYHHWHRKQLALRQPAKRYIANVAIWFPEQFGEKSEHSIG